MICITTHYVVQIYLVEPESREVRGGRIVSQSMAERVPATTGGPFSTGFCSRCRCLAKQKTGICSFNLDFASFGEFEKKCIRNHNFRIIEW